MFKPLAFEDRMRRHQLRMMWLDLLALESRCFYLELRVRRLERRWRRSPPAHPHRLRMDRMRLRHDFEMLKIDLESFERRARPLLKSPPQ